MIIEDAAAKKKRKGKFREYVEAIVTAVLIAFVIRSFVIEPFKIPTSSMVPTLLVGDHIFVNKFIYGLRIPFTKIRFFDKRKPHRGEVVVFNYPVDESKDFIKRVVGLPGDVIKVIGKDLYINGEALKHVDIPVKFNPDDKRTLLTNDTQFKKIPYVQGWPEIDFMKEDLGDTEHLIQFESGGRELGEYIAANGGEVTVPEGKFFVMGDNRDNSLDGREWGFVPMENLKGKAIFVWLSLDKDFGLIRYKRFGHLIE